MAPAQHSPVTDVNMFTLDDTIRVVGVKGITNDKGVAYDGEDPNTPDLVLCVCGKDPSSNKPTVYAVNGKWTARQTSQYLYLLFQEELHW